MNFLERADAGTMQFDETRLDLHRAGHAEVNALCRRTGFVFQNYNLFANKTALQNVTEGLIIARKMPKAKAEEIGHGVLKTESSMPPSCIGRHYSGMKQQSRSWSGRLLFQ